MIEKQLCALADPAINYWHQQNNCITRGVLSRRGELFMPLHKCQWYLLQYIGYGSALSVLKKEEFHLE